MVSKKQEAFFDAFGFLVLQGAYSTSETDRISDAFDEVMKDALPDGSDPSQLREKFVIDPGFVERHPTLEQIVPDPRVSETVDNLLGPGAYYTGSDGALRVGDTDWHPDQGWDPSIPGGSSEPNHNELSGHYYPGIKVALYLDPVTQGEGCLSMVPGSHLSPFHEQLWSLHCDIPDRGPHLVAEPGINEFGIEAESVPRYPIASQPGDIVFFLHKLWHASFGGITGRRMIALGFKAAPANDQQRSYRQRQDMQARTA
jgi:hypothetical protein